jgi:hypothetical protein
VVRQTLSGALDSLTLRVEALVHSVEGQDAAAQQLRDVTDAAYDRAREGVDEGMQNGSLLRGEVLARWQEFVGTGEWMRSLQAQVGRLRDRLTAALSGRPTPAQDLQVALESSVEQLLRSEAEAASERTVTAWRALPAGPELLGGRDRELEQVSADFPDAAGEEVRSWQGHVLDLVRSEGADKRSTARILSFGVNGAGFVVMVAVFAQTGGLTGGEIAVAGGTSALGQRVLEAVFGDAAVRALAAKARADLGGARRPAAARGAGALRRPRRRRLARPGQRRCAARRQPCARRGAPVSRREAPPHRPAGRPPRRPVEVADGRLEVPKSVAARTLLAKAGAA